MLRDRFSSLTAGVSLGNFNALDMWIWYGTFTNNTDGVTNSSGAGNFHVYNSNFTNSAEADLKIYNTGGFDFRWNYSINAGQFMLSQMSAEITAISTSKAMPFWTRAMVTAS